jgi:hypothetical protein
MTKSNAAKTPKPKAERDGLGAKAWTALISVGFFFITTTWIVASVLTATPSVDPTVRDQILALANSQQPDPDAASRYPELIQALIEFDHLTERIVRDIPIAADDYKSETRVAWYTILYEPDPEMDDLDSYPQKAKGVRQVLDIMEAQGAFDRMTELLQSPNLASNYLTLLDAAGKVKPALEWELPYQSSWRHYASALAARSRVAAERGDIEAAAAHLESASRLPGVQTRQAFAYEHLDGAVAAIQQTIEIERLATDSNLTPQALESLIRAQSQLAELGDLAVVIRAEQVILRDTIYRAHTAGGRYIPSIGDQITGYSVSNEPMGLRDRFLKDVTGYLKANRRASLSAAHKLFQNFEDALNEHDPIVREHLIESAHDPIISLNDRYEFLKSMTPVLGASIRTYFETRARITALEILLAMADYRLDHAEWPGTLDQLVPDHLDAIPINPQTGDPFEFNHTPGEPPSLERLGLEDRY